MNDRTSNAAIHEHLARHGIGVFALDFRLAPAHRYPAAVEDVNYAIRWLKVNADRLGVRARLIAALAHRAAASCWCSPRSSPEDSLVAIVLQGTPTKT